MDERGTFFYIRGMDESLALALDVRERKFADNILAGMNKSESALKAGYKTRQMSQKLLVRPHVKAYVKARLEQRRKGMGISKERVIAELARIAFCNVADLKVDWDQLKNWEDLSEDQKAAISEIRVKVTSGETRHGKEWKTKETIIKMHNKLPALDALSKYLGLFEKDNTQKSTTPNITLNYMPSNPRNEEEVVDITPEPEKISEKNQKSSE